MENKIYKSRSRFYAIWVGINNRVGKAKGYENIHISKEWEDFGKFYIDMYDLYCNHVEKNSEKDTTIERIDRNKGYCKENCKWATMEEQGNNRSNNKYITYKNETLTASQWSRRIGISRQALAQRFKNGWSLEEALSDASVRKEKIDNIIRNVMRSYYGTKRRSELIMGLEHLRELIE